MAKFCVDSFLKGEVEFSFDKSISEASYKNLFNPELISYKKVKEILKGKSDEKLTLNLLQAKARKKVLSSCMNKQEGTISFGPDKLSYSFSLILPVKENKESISENDISSLVKKMLVSNSSPVWQNYSCTFDFSLDDCSVSIEITKNEKDKIAGNVFLSYPEIQLEDYEISFVADYEKGVIDFQNEAKGDFVSDYEDELAALLEEELQKDIPELDEER